MRVSRLTVSASSAPASGARSVLSGPGSQRVPSSLLAQYATACGFFMPATARVASTPVASFTASSALALLTLPR